MAVRKAACAFAAVSLILALAGCTTTRPSVSRSKGGGLFTDGTSAPATAAASPPAGVDVAASRCRDVDVTERSAPSADNSPGHVTRWLVVTNVSTTNCTLFGFAKVTYFSSEQFTIQDVNDPARHNADTPSLVRLAPQQGAHIVVRTAPVESFSADACRAVPVLGYLVVLPNESEPSLVSARGRQCSARGVNVAEISPFQTGG